MILIYTEGASFQKEYVCQLYWMALKSPLLVDIQIFQVVCSCVIFVLVHVHVYVHVGWCVLCTCTLRMYYTYMYNHVSTCKSIWGEVKCLNVAECADLADICQTLLLSIRNTHRHHRAHTCKSTQSYTCIWPKPSIGRTCSLSMK